jgi:ketosteroid isomerase-like protein/uncharacterized protein YndB with AHSA1/START domain
MTTDGTGALNSRGIDLEVEVYGTPEQVWDAIATGPGITAWMQPTDVEEREGGTFSYDMGTGTGRVYGTVTGWEPPRRFAQESRWELAGGSAAMLATEWIVQARSGGTCVVRMVMTGFGVGTEWDTEIDGMTSGLRVALDSLRRYLAHAGAARSSRAGQGPVTLTSASQDEFAIYTLFTDRAEAIRAKDVDGSIAAYSPDVLKFDLAPPLASTGAQDSDGLKYWYGTWQGPIGYELRDLSISAGADIAFSHSLNHMTGTTTDGEQTDLWFRETVCLRKTSGTWKIVHEHNSVPLYMDGTGKAATDLKPPTADRGAL